MVVVRVIENMNLFRIDEEIIVNIGIINGGIVINIVIGEVNIIVEVRSLKENKLDV